MKLSDYRKNYLNQSGESHAHCVYNISLKIFKLLKNIFPNEPLLNIQNDKKLLEAASILHDIGTFLNSSGITSPHNKTGAKLILENGIEELSEEETIITALCVRYHRGAKPKERHKLYSKLQQSDKNKVLVISSILRLADALDCNHIQNVENISLYLDSTGRTLTLNPSIDIIFNKGMKKVFNKKKSLFEDVFKLKIYLRNE